jgi:large subunit ribosomal protein L4e
MKAKVFGLDGNAKEINLPKVFETEYNPTIIKRAVLAVQSARKQAKGTDPRAGLKTTAEYKGMRGKSTAKRTINVGRARLPRTKNKRDLLSGKVARVPHSVGGRRAHPPKAQTKIIEKINKKEKKIALESAIAATANIDLVGKRFVFEGKLPLIVEEKFEDLEKTKKVIDALIKIGAGKDLENARGKIRKRAGKGKARGRTRKIKKSVLIVTGKNSPVLKASRNLTGVDAVTINSLNVELLAPGAEAGRLVVWTKDAIEGLEKGKAKIEKKVKESKKKKRIKVNSKKKETKEKENKDEKKEETKKGKVKTNKSVEKKK